MCNFCNEQKLNLLNKTIDAGILGEHNLNVYIDATKGKAEMWLILRNQKHKEKIEEIEVQKINFCPMCGRKLDLPYSEFSHVKKS